MIQPSLTRRKILLGIGNRGLKATAKVTPTLRVLVSSRVAERRMNLARPFKAGKPAVNKNPRRVSDD